MKSIRSCGVNTAEENYNTCEIKKVANNCGVNGRVCFCKQCYGRFCNDSPLYKAATMASNAVTGSVSSMMDLMNDLSWLLRLGMFDFSLFSSNSTET